MVKLKPIITIDADKSSPTYVWNPEWIQPYESYWSIIKKFCFVNVLSSNLFKLRFGTIDGEEDLENILGFSRSQYIREQESMVYSRIGTYINDEKTIRPYIWICKKCNKNGFHSIFHQISIFKNCIYHQNETLVRYYGLFNERTLSQMEFETISNNRDLYKTFSQWKRKKYISDKQFYNFISMPEIFSEFPCLHSEEDIVIRGVDKSDCLLNPLYKEKKQIIPNNDFDSIIKLCTPDSLRKPDGLLKYWSRQDIIKRFRLRKVLYGRIYRRMPQKLYFQGDVSIFRYSYMDLSKSLLHYLLKLFSLHKKCISEMNPRSRTYRHNNCPIAKLFYEFETLLIQLNNRYILLRPQIIEGKNEAHLCDTLRYFIRKSRYTYDTLYKEYIDPIHHISEQVGTTDAYAYHIYYEAFFNLLQGMMISRDMNTNSCNFELRTYESKNEVWFYPTAEIKKAAKIILNHYSNTGCENNIK